MYDIFNLIDDIGKKKNEIDDFIKNILYEDE
jgi:hypothetical protein